MADEKQIHSEPQPDNPFAKLDARFTTTTEALNGAVAITTLRDADEALGFLENHPRPGEIAAEGTAILEDPVQLKRLIRKIDWTIAPLLASVYFLQFLDKTTLSYTAVMGIRTDTHLVGQDYSDVSMLFYIGESLNESSPYPALMRFGPVRFLGCGVPHAVSCTAHLQTGCIPGGQHYDMGGCPLLPRCLHEFC
jgi:hypothetical protein